MNQEKTQSKKGRLFILSAPSGAGKTTLCRELMKMYPDLNYSISYTTRAPRKGEQGGVDYHYIDKQEFKRGIDKGKWAEWAVVHDYYYGTSAEFLDDCIRNGRHVLLDIDVQGAMQIVKKFPEGITIFITVPAMNDLRKRLESRNGDNQAVIEKRLKNAEREMTFRDQYRHVVVNDRLQDAVAELKHLMDGYMGISDAETLDPGTADS